MTKLVFGIAAISMVASASALAQPAGGMPAMPVLVDAARMDTTEQWREVTGELRAVRRALLAAEEEGLVIALEQQEGEPVEAGKVIARLRDTRARLDVQRAEAELAVKVATVAER